VLKDIYVKKIAPHEDNFEAWDYVGLEELCIDNKYAYFISAYMLLIPGFLPNCSFTFIPRAYYPGMFSIPTAKRSPYRGILNFK
jgi:hypothetical protein